VKVGIETGRHDTCGADLVNHCVNDILVQGARPLFFLDYVVMGRLDPAVLKAVMEGIVRGCRENGTALLGGETAEMPGICAAGDYDVAVDFENALEVSWKLNVRDIVVDYRPGVGMRLSPHFSPEDSKLDHAFAAIPPHR
jgi:phosphoribosylformylglycinamidine cyclo-ligase